MPFFLGREIPKHPLREHFGTPWPDHLSKADDGPAVFNSKFISPFQRKSSQIPPLGIRIHSHLQDIGFRRKDTLQCPTLPTPPWLLHRPQINYSLRSLYKDDTAREIFRHNFNELCADYNHFTRLYTDGSKIGDGVASAVVWQNRAKLFAYQATQASLEQNYAISLALNIIHCCRDKDFIIFSDSMSSLQALSRFKLEIDLVQIILKNCKSRRIILLLQTLEKYCSVLDSKLCQHSW